MAIIKIVPVHRPSGKFREGQAWGFRRPRVRNSDAARHASVEDTARPARFARASHGGGKLAVPKVWQPWRSPAKTTHRSSRRGPPPAPAAPTRRSATRNRCGPPSSRHVVSRAAGSRPAPRSGSRSDRTGAGRDARSRAGRTWSGSRAWDHRRLATIDRGRRAPRAAGSSPRAACGDESPASDHRRARRRARPLLPRSRPERAGRRQASWTRSRPASPARSRRRSARVRDRRPRPRHRHRARRRRAHLSRAAPPMLARRAGPAHRARQ